MYFLSWLIKAGGNGLSGAQVTTVVVLRGIYSKLKSISDYESAQKVVYELHNSQKVYHQTILFVERLKKTLVSGLTEILEETKPKQPYPAKN